MFKIKLVFGNSFTLIEIYEYFCNPMKHETSPTHPHRGIKLGVMVQAS